MGDLIHKNAVRSKSSKTFFPRENSQFSISLITYGSGISGPRIAKSLYTLHTERSSESPPDKRHIGLFGCVCIIVGCVLGSGIFAAPQEISILTGNDALTLLVWFTYGVIALVAALCYVELGCTIPVSGGDYAYLNACFGSLPAFLFQWSVNFITIPVTCAILSIVTAKNLVNPYLEDPNGITAHWSARLLAIMLIMLFCYINCRSAVLTEKIQGYLMLVNSVTIALICSCGIAFMIQNKGLQKDANFTLRLPEPPPSIMSSGWEIAKFQVLQTVKALYQASFSYFGYTYINYVTEELKNPFRNLPLGACISIPLIIFLNVFVNFCYIGTLPKSKIMKTQTIANDMLLAVLPPNVAPYISWLAPCLVSLAVSGGLSSSIMTCSRISCAGAKNGHFPKAFGTIHMEHLTPVVSIAWIGILASLYVLVATHVPTLISVATYLEAAFNCFCIYGLIHLRITKPELPRPIKFPLILPISYSIVSTFLFLVPIITIDEQTVESTLPGIGGAIFVVFTGIPVYFLFIYKNGKCDRLKKVDLYILSFLQKLFLVLPERSIVPINETQILAK